jgi:transposase
LRRIGRAKVRFALRRDAEILSCYETGPDGFWLDGFLHELGVNNLVVDSSSIEVNRRVRRAKAEGPDAVRLVGMLVRYDTKDSHYKRIGPPVRLRRKPFGRRAKGCPEV